MAAARQYKADEKPATSGQIEFERVLTEAGVPADQRKELMAEED
jgi:hypothetical protein